jgi:hypothetical protein
MADLCSSTDSSVKQHAEMLSTYQSSHPLKRLSSDSVLSEAFGNNKTSSMTSQNSCKEQSFVTTSSSHSDILTRLAQARADLDKRYERHASQSLAEATEGVVGKPGRRWTQVTEGVDAAGRMWSQSASRQKDHGLTRQVVTQPPPPSSKSVQPDYVFATITIAGGPPPGYKATVPTGRTYLSNQQYIAHHRSHYPTIPNTYLTPQPIAVPNNCPKYQTTTISPQSNPLSKRPRYSYNSPLEQSHHPPIKENGQCSSLFPIHCRGAARERTPVVTPSKAISEALQPDTARAQIPTNRRKPARFRRLRSLSCPPQLYDAARQPFESADFVAGGDELSRTGKTRDYEPHFTVIHHPTTRVCDNGSGTIIEVPRGKFFAYKISSGTSTAPSSPTFPSQNTNLPALSTTLLTPLSGTSFAHYDYNQSNAFTNSYGNGFDSSSAHGLNASSNGFSASSNSFSASSNSFSASSNDCNVSNNGLNALSNCFYNTLGSGFDALNNGFNALANDFPTSSNDFNASSNDFNASSNDFNASSNSYDGFDNFDIGISHGNSNTYSTNFDQSIDCCPQSAACSAGSRNNFNFDLNSSLDLPNDPYIINLATFDDFMAMQEEPIADPQCLAQSAVPHEAQQYLHQTQYTQRQIVSSNNPQMMRPPTVLSPKPSPPRLADTVPKYTIKHEMLDGPNSQGFRCTDGQKARHIETWIYIEKELGYLKPASRITFECTVPGLISTRDTTLPFWHVQALVEKKHAAGAAMNMSIQEQHAKAVAQENAENAKAQRRAYKEEKKARETPAKERRNKTRTKEWRRERKQQRRDAEKKAAAEEQKHVDVELVEYYESEDEAMWGSGELVIVETGEYMAETKAAEEKALAEEVIDADDLEAQMMAALEENEMKQAAVESNEKGDEKGDEESEESEAE